MADDVSLKSDALPLKDKLDYAWKWFEYHASQRLIAFNFLLVLMGALSVGYYKAFTDKQYSYGLIVGLFGVFISGAFHNIDRRNVELLQKGREALKSLERLPEFSLLAEDPCRLLIKAEKRRSIFISHAWLRWMSISLLLLFLLASIVSALKLVESYVKMPVP